MEEHYGDKSIALGGTFVIQKGKAKIHIMVINQSKMKFLKFGYFFLNCQFSLN